MGIQNIRCYTYIYITHNWTQKNHTQDSHSWLFMVIYLYKTHNYTQKNPSLYIYICIHSYNSWFYSYITPRSQENIPAQFHSIFVLGRRTEENTIVESLRLSRWDVCRTFILGGFRPKMVDFEWDNGSIGTIGIWWEFKYWEYNGNDIYIYYNMIWHNVI